MSSQTVATLFGLTLLGGLAFVVVAIFVPTMREAVSRFSLPLAGAVASAAMLGSLYFSEIADFIPCKLCWYQRIAMYPLAVLLASAAFSKDRAVFRYVMLIATIGMAVSMYHVWIQWFPEASNFCEFNNPCSAVWVEALGSITIPQMAGLSFLLILLIGSISRWTDARDL